MPRRLCYGGTVTKPGKLGPKDRLMLVNLIDPRNNEMVADWAPKWEQLQEIVSKSLEVEESNRGRWVQFVTTIEQQLIEWLPPRPIRRIDAATIESYVTPRAATS